MADNPLQAHLDQLLSSRAAPKTICPSEAARALSASELHSLGASDWRDLMPSARQFLFGMRDRGEVEIMQRGEVLSNDITLDNVKGPIRARKKQ